MSKGGAECEEGRQSVEGDGATMLVASELSRTAGYLNSTQHNRPLEQQMFILFVRREGPQAEESWWEEIWEVW